MENDNMCGSSEPKITSEYDRGYGKGYAASLKRVSKLKFEIARLKKAKMPEAGYDETIAWLLKMAEAFVQVVDLMLEHRGHKGT